MHMHSGTTALSALQRNEATALLDESINHAQAETGGIAVLLGGEEGFECPCAHVVTHAAALVNDTEQDVIATRVARCILAQLALLQTQPPTSATRHRIEIGREHV